MRRTLSGLLLLLILSGAKKPAAPPPPVGVTVTRSGGAEVVRTVLPGWLSSLELPRGADGKLDLVFLLGTEKLDPEDSGSTYASPESGSVGPPGPRSLQRLDLSGQGALRTLLDDVPAGALGVLDLDGDGAEEILLFDKGQVRSVGTSGLLSVLDLPGTELRFPSRWMDMELPGVVAGDVGRLRLFVPGGGSLSPAVERALPAHATRERWGLRLTSPRVRAVRGGGRLLAAGPEAEGKQRLRSLLIGTGPEGSTLEMWSVLPGPEDVDAAWYALIDGRPSLIVTTNSADKIGIFESKKLRVFPLTSDRTRAGRRPVLASQTTSHRWLPVVPIVRDVDQDGKEDLVVLQQDGMGGGQTIAEIFFGRGDGRFETPGRRQKWDLDNRGWSYGQDLTGDGIADLAVAEPRRLVVFPGTKEPRRALLERKPLEISLEVGGGEGAGMRRLRVVDLDGDGRSEAVLAGQASEDRAVIMIVRWR